VGKFFIRCLYDCNATANVATEMMNEMVLSRICVSGTKREMNRPANGECFL